MCGHLCGLLFGYLMMSTWLCVCSMLMIKGKMECVCMCVCANINGVSPCIVVFFEDLLLYFVYSWVSICMYVSLMFWVVFELLVFFLMFIFPTKNQHTHTHTQIYKPSKMN